MIVTNMQIAKILAWQVAEVTAKKPISKNMYFTNYKQRVSASLNLGSHYFELSMDFYTVQTCADQAELLT